MAFNLNTLGGHEFEDLIEHLLIKMGFATEGRKKAADGGIDIVAVSSQPLVSGRYVIQCKRYSNSVSSPVVRDLYGVVNSENANKGILITTSSFTADAIEFAKGKPLELIDGAKLVELLTQYALLTPQGADKSNAEMLKISLARNEFSGLSKKYELLLKEADSDLTLMHRTPLGNQGDRRTYVLYRNLSLDIFRRLRGAQAAAREIFGSLNEFYHSQAVDPQEAFRLRKNITEYGDFLIGLLREVRNVEPPPEMSRAHEVMYDIVHTYVANFVAFLKQHDDMLANYQAGGQYQTPYNANVDTREWGTAFDEGMKQFNQR
jgi:hypothetical protein